MTMDLSASHSDYYLNQPIFVESVSQNT